MRMTIRMPFIGMLFAAVASFGMAASSMATPSDGAMISHAQSVDNDTDLSVHSIKFVAVDLKCNDGAAAYKSVAASLYFDVTDSTGVDAHNVAVTCVDGHWHSAHGRQPEQGARNSVSGKALKVISARQAFNRVPPRTL